MPPPMRRCQPPQYRYPNNAMTIALADGGPSRISSIDPDVKPVITNPENLVTEANSAPHR